MRSGEVNVDDLFGIFANTADGAFIINEEQRIIYWNQTAQEMLGYTFNEVEGQPCYKILGGCDDKSQPICCFHCQVVSIIGEGKPVPNYNIAVHTKAGKKRWINVSILSTLVEDESAPVVIHLFRDATLLKQNDRFVHRVLNAIDGLEESPLPPDNLISLEEALAGELTNREQEVLSLLAQGSSTDDISKTLSISSATVRNHVQNIFHKLQVHSRLEAVAYAVEHELVNKE